MSSTPTVSWPANWLACWPCDVRRAEPALRRGRQDLRDISGDGRSFGLPSAFGGDRVRSVVAWSRILSGREVLCAINTDPFGPRDAWVTIDARLHQAGDALRCLYPSDAASPPPSWSRPAMASRFT